MQLTDLNVIKEAHTWLSTNKAVWLCTILNTYGSAPRPIGSIFATDGDKRAGSISGGCLEDAFIEMINQGQFNELAQIFSYGNHAQEKDIIRELPCGGTIRLLVEYIPATSIHIDHLSTWLGFANAKQPFVREIHLTSEQKSVVSSDTTPASQVIESSESVILTYAQVWSLLLIGIGQVTEHVAKLGLMAGFDVKLCDMRKELAASWSFTAEHGGVDVQWQSPDLFIEQHCNERSAVLALAHDPRIDDVALMTVVDCNAFYSGAMGSSRTTKNRNERLQRICQLSEQQLSTIHAPIGLNIGSKTPMEIAIAVLADVIRVRHGKDKSEL